MHAHDRTLLASLGFADPDKKNPRHDLACQYLALSENHEKLARLVVPAAPKNVTYQLPGNLPCGYPSVEATRTYTVSIGSPILEWPITKGEGRYKSTIGFVDAVLPFSRAWTDDGRVSGWVVAEAVEIEIDPLCFPEHVRELAERLTGNEPDHWYSSVTVRIETLAADLRKGPPREWVDIRLRRRGDKIVAGVPTFRPYERPYSSHGVGEWAACVEVKIGRAGVGDVLRQVALYREHTDGRHTKWVLATPFPYDADDLATLRAADIAHVRLGERFEQWVARRTGAPRLEDSPEV